MAEEKTIKNEEEEMKLVILFGVYALLEIALLINYYYTNSSLVLLGFIIGLFVIKDDIDQVRLQRRKKKWSK